MTKQPVRIGFFSSGCWPWLRQTPRNDGLWNNCQYIINTPEAAPFDFVVVYGAYDHPIPAPANPARSILLSGEPTSIKRYLPEYAAQFGTVYSADRDMPHPCRIEKPTGLPWHYGIPTAFPERYDDSLTYAQIAERPVPAKSRTISVICSSKAFTETHRQRLAFVESLKALMGDELEVYGRGFRDFTDKAEIIDPFRYHIALENNAHENFFTEKITDTYLGHAFPFYWGCPNLASYLPQDSFMAIDMAKPAETARIIRNAIADNRFEKSGDALLRARALVLDTHNIFSILTSRINELNIATAPASSERIIRLERDFLPAPAAARRRLLDEIRCRPWLYRPLRSLRNLLRARQS